MFFIGFIKANYFLFFIEYFIGSILIFILIVYTLIINNIFGIFVCRVISYCLSFIFFLLIYMILNDILFFTIDLTNYNNIGLNKLLIFDYISIISKLLILFLAFIFFLIITNVLKFYKLTSFEFLIILTFNIFGLILLCSSYDLIIIFLSFELTALSSYFLVSLRKSFNYSIESGLKYLIIGTFSSSFFLLGSFLLYYYLGTLILVDIYLLIFNIEYLFFNNYSLLFKKFIIKVELFNILLNIYVCKYWFLEYITLNIALFNNTKPIIELAFLLLCLSIFIKIGFAPFHIWSIQIYEVSVSIIVFFFMLLVKLSYFLILFRIYHVFFNINNTIFSYLFNFIAFLNIFISSFSNLKEKKIKTLLVYSSLSHIGYILLAYNMNCFLGFEMFYFYIIVYLLSNIIIWYTIIQLKKHIYYKKKISKNISDFILLNKTNKILAFALLITFLSIGGIPPLIGFFSKLGIFLVLISEKFFSFCIFISFCSVVSIFYYLRLIKVLYFENKTIGELFQPICSHNIFIFIYCIFNLLFLFINPKLLYLIVHKIIIFEYL